MERCVEYLRNEKGSKGHPLIQCLQQAGPGTPDLLRHCTDNLWQSYSYHTEEFRHGLQAVSNSSPSSVRVVREEEEVRQGCSQLRVLCCWPKGQHDLENISRQESSMHRTVSQDDDAITRAGAVRKDRATQDLPFLLEPFPTALTERACEHQPTNSHSAHKLIGRWAKRWSYPHAWSGVTLGVIFLQSWKPCQNSSTFIYAVKYSAFFSLPSTGVWIQSLTLVRQVLYHLICTPALIFR
jgi:hypothetical protein